MRIRLTWQSVVMLLGGLLLGGVRGALILLGIMVIILVLDLIFRRWK